MKIQKSIILFITCLNLKGLYDARIYVNSSGAYHYLYNLNLAKIARLKSSGVIIWNYPS